jgi:mersacidin/lichenicidin family type 2 lantibiotic
MSTEQILRAWKDVRYRQSLSEEEQALLPTHPAGTLELSASALVPEATQEGFTETITTIFSVVVSCVTL